MIILNLYNILYYGFVLIPIFHLRQAKVHNLALEDYRNSVLQIQEKMLELYDETQAGESERSEAEICQEMPGKASGYNQNYAFSSTQQHDSTDTVELRRTIERQQKLIQDLEEQLITFK